jgi:signal transduction histidine kinase
MQSCDLISCLKSIRVLDGLDDHEYAWIAENGVHKHANPGEAIFREGDPATVMFFVLSGEVHMRHDRAARQSLVIGRSAQVTGLLPFSRMKFYTGTALAVDTVCVIEIVHSSFEEMLNAIPTMGRRCVAVLLDRAREVTRIEQQEEKLTALGKLAGNLSHELNNPASAAKSSATNLLRELERQKLLRRTLYQGGFSLAELDFMHQWQEELSARAVVPSPLDDIDREDALTAWFEKAGFKEDSWEVIPDLFEGGVLVEDLERIQKQLGAAHLMPVLRIVSSSLRVKKMGSTISSAADRIFELSRAVKDYAYMDQAPIQDVDLSAALENTLTMLRPRLSSITVNVDVPRDLPLVSAYGSELNQVWMALLENAVDSIVEYAPSKGCIDVRVNKSGESILVEVWDNGHGIPASIHDRIFEPFFTTRPPGKCLGLGLDAAQRIVKKHGGYIRIQRCDPDATCMLVSLPIERPHLY